MANTLFSFDDDRAINKGPVTCFGIRFENDEKRCEFFREELRKKLPELRLLDGFPNASDDEIVALSDPPYFTACPNPWLNDFIDEWEKEKKQYSRSSIDIKEPYAVDVSEGKSNDVYNAHTYHTKVPYPAIMRYILHYTQPGDIIYDGFGGTGMTGVAAALCGEADEVAKLSSKGKVGYRRCICSDLSPAASAISAVFNSPIDTDEFARKAKDILEQVNNELGWMYRTKHTIGYGIIQHVIWSDVFICPECGNELVFNTVASDIETGKVNKEFHCPHCGSLLTKKKMAHAIESSFDSTLGKPVTMSKTVPVLIKYKFDGKIYQKQLDSEDLSLIERINKMEVEDWFPTDELTEGYNKNQPMQTNGIHYIHQFYSRRNLIILARIHKLIGDDPALRFWFTSQLLNLSKLNRYRPEVSFPYNPLNGTLYIASQVCESNVFDAYKNKIEKLRKGLSLVNSRNATCVMSATALNLKSNSIDYIFTDPPFGSNIMYSDLNCIWESWIKVRTNNDKEAIINPFQNKSLFEYQNLMNASLKEYYRILKPGKWLTMEFSNTSAAVWNSIQNALQGVGFVVANVSALDKQQGSFKSVTSPTAVKQDLIITCYKPTDEITSKFATPNSSTSNLWDFVEDVLEHLPVHLKRDNATTAVVERSPKILFDRLIAYYVQHGYQVPIDAAEFQKGLKEHFVERDGMYFTAEQAIEYEDKKKETTAFVSLALLVGSEAEGIEWLKRKLEDGPKTYSEILPDWMQDLVKPKKGDTLPELMQILDENFLKDEKSRWYIPDLNDQAQLDAVKTKRLLKEFELYIDAKKVKNARLEALRAGFKECYKNKDFATIVAVGDKIDEELLTTDEVLLRFYDIASSRI